MKPQHTPTPMNVVNNGSGVCYLVDAKGREIATLNIFADGKRNVELEEESHDMHAFIVRAVNSHEELIVALKSLRHQLALVGGMDKQLEVAFIRAGEALAKAEGVESETKAEGKE